MLCDLSALQTLQQTRNKYSPGAAPDSSDV
jgi:hypothetical protein